MGLSPTRRSSLKALADGGLNALDIEIDNLPLNSHFRGFLHRVVEGADKTISDILTDKKILERAEAAAGTKYVAPPSSEVVEQPLELGNNSEPVVSDTVNEVTADEERQVISHTKHRNVFDI